MFPFKLVDSEFTSSIDGKSFVANSILEFPLFVDADPFILILGNNKVVCLLWKPAAKVIMADKSKQKYKGKNNA